MNDSPTPEQSTLPANVDDRPLDPHVIDAEYRTYPPFEEWARCAVDGTKWTAQTSRLTELDHDSRDRLQRARAVVKRVAAIDTGAIEGLYDLDAGTTITIAMQLATAQAALDKVTVRARELIEPQLRGYDYVIDLATQATPVSEAAIRNIHERLCEGQGTYLAHTPQGPQASGAPAREIQDAAEPRSPARRFHPCVRSRRCH
jgi:hypothetical protein